MLAVIGGSGVYHIDGLVNTRWVTAQSAFGTPSADPIFASERWSGGSSHRGSSRAPRRRRLP